MDKILKLKGCRCGSVWILLFACFLLWAGLPVHAANAASASAVLPVSQEMTITNGENETVSEDFTYCLTAKDSDTPMPEGSEGSVYTFVLHGTQTVNCGPIVYGHAGVYHYTLAQKSGEPKEHYTYDTSVYDVTVYVKNAADGTLTTQVIMENASGEKVDQASFSNGFTGVKKPDPKPAKPTQVPKTGDTMSIELWYGALVFFAAVAASVLVVKRKLAKRENVL